MAVGTVGGGGGTVGGGGVLAGAGGVPRVAQPFQAVNYGQDPNNPQWDQQLHNPANAAPGAFQLWGQLLFGHGLAGGSTASWRPEGQFGPAPAQPQRPSGGGLPPRLGGNLFGQALLRTPPPGGGEGSTNNPRPAAGGSTGAMPMWVMPAPTPVSDSGASAGGGAGAGGGVPMVHYRPGMTGPGGVPIPAPLAGSQVPWVAGMHGPPSPSGGAGTSIHSPDAPPPAGGGPGGTGAWAGQATVSGQGSTPAVQMPGAWGGPGNEGPQRPIGSTLPPVSPGLGVIVGAQNAFPGNRPAQLDAINAFIAQQQAAQESLFPGNTFTGVPGLTSGSLPGSNQLPLTMIPSQTPNINDAYLGGPWPPQLSGATVGSLAQAQGVNPEMINPYTGVPYPQTTGQTAPGNLPGGNAPTLAPNPQYGPGLSNPTPAGASRPVIGNTPAAGNNPSGFNLPGGGGPDVIFQGPNPPSNFAGGGQNVPTPAGGGTLPRGGGGAGRPWFPGLQLSLLNNTPTAEGLIGYAGLAQAALNAPAAIQNTLYLQGNALDRAHGIDDFTQAMNQPGAGPSSDPAYLLASQNNPGLFSSGALSLDNYQLQNAAIGQAQQQLAPLTPGAAWPAGVPPVPPGMITQGTPVYQPGPLVLPPPGGYAGPAPAPTTQQLSQMIQQIYRPGAGYGQ